MVGYTIIIKVVLFFILILLPQQLFSGIAI